MQVGADRSRLVLEIRRVVSHPEGVSKSSDKWKGIGFALLAAVLFGLSTPLAKSVSPLVEPALLAGLLYLGSGIGLGVYSLLRFGRRQRGAREAALKRADAPWLAGAIAAGGVVGPMRMIAAVAMRVTWVRT